MGRGNRKQTREVSLPSTFCLCPELSIAAAGRGELLAPCALQLPFGPALVIHHRDPLLAAPILHPLPAAIALLSACPSGCSCQRISRQPVTLPSIRSHPFPDHHSPPAQGPPARANRSITVRNITGPAGLPAPIPLGPAPAGARPQPNSIPGNRGRQQLLTAAETSSAPISRRDRGEGNVTQTDYNCASSEANLLIYRNDNK